MRVDWSGPRVFELQARFTITDADYESMEELARELWGEIEKRQGWPTELIVRGRDASIVLVSSDMK